MYRTWPHERCGRGDERSASIKRWMIWRRVTTMICMVLVSSMKLKIKYIILYVMVNATPWIDTRKGERGSEERVSPRVGIVDR
jgi:hypothetical protein